MENRDAIHLARLRDDYGRRRVLPSYAEIGRMLGLRSKASVAKLVGRLVRQDYLERGDGGRRAPGPRFFERRLVGRAPAGFPSPATELLDDALTIDAYLVDHPGSTVLVQVEGDSMIEAGIHPGDFVVTERRREARPGRIVVAVVDGDYTVKYLERDAAGYYLRPANAHYPDIRPEGELELFGVVVGQFRKLGG